MKLSARVDYAVRAALELAAAAPNTIKAEQLATEQGISTSFLENILGDLRRAGLVESQRGRDGGYRLTRDPAQIKIAEVMRAETGNLADIHGNRPEALDYPGAARHLTDVWVAARSAYRRVLESISLRDVVSGNFPNEITALLSEPDAWSSHWPG